MTAKEKAIELVQLMYERTDCGMHEPGYNCQKCDEQAKQCALIAVENEYYWLREMLFSLRSSRIIKNEKVYLSRLDELNKSEQQVKQQIEEL